MLKDCLLRELAILHVFVPLIHGGLDNVFRHLGKEIKHHFSKEGCKDITDVRQKCQSAVMPEHQTLRPIWSLCLVKQTVAGRTSTASNVGEIHHLRYLRSTGQVSGLGSNPHVFWSEVGMLLCRLLGTYPGVSMIVLWQSQMLGT